MCTFRSAESLNTFPQILQSFVPSECIVDWWYCSATFWMKPRPQILQSKRLSPNWRFGKLSRRVSIPVWIRWWRRIFECWENIFPHSGHSNWGSFCHTTSECFVLICSLIYIKKNLQIKLLPVLRSVVKMLLANRTGSYKSSVWRRTDFTTGRHCARIHFVIFRRWIFCYGIFDFFDFTFIFIIERIVIKFNNFLCAVIRLIRILLQWVGDFQLALKARVMLE